MNKSLLKNLLLGTCLLAGIGASGQIPSDVHTPNDTKIVKIKTTTPPKWKLVWREEFNQKKHFDESSWSKIGRGTSPWNSHMSDFDSCYDMRNGKLILRILPNHSLKNDTAPYITGGICSRHKVTFTYGKVAVRARLHGAKGAWPAIWMLPDDNTPWPDGGEIDIMERLNHDKIAYQTTHSYYTHVLNKKSYPKQGSTGPIDPDGFNVYAVDITPDSLTYYINDKLTYSYPRVESEGPMQYPFGKPFYLLLDMQIGGSWVGEIDPKDYPTEMEIDWVRYYQRKK
jgi:beta-glucanase (GH16 family)